MENWQVSYYIQYYLSTKMSELSVEPQIRITQTPVRPNLQIETDDNSQIQSNPPSQVWLQYSQFNIKTPTNLKFPTKNTSQYVEFSNNLYKDGGTSEYAPPSEEEHLHLQAQQNTGSVRKHKMISELSIEQNQKNQILGIKQAQAAQHNYGSTFDKQEWIEMRESLNSRSSYEARDVQAGKRKFVLDQLKEDKKPKEGLGCSSCSLM